MKYYTNMHDIPVKYRHLVDTETSANYYVKQQTTSLLPNLSRTSPIILFDDTLGSGATTDIVVRILEKNGFIKENIWCFSFLNELKRK